MRVPILAWIFQVIPEGIALAALVMCLATGDLPWKRILKTGISCAVFVYLIRLLPFTPGVHVIVLAAVLGACSIYFGGLEMKRALVFSAISMAALVLFEFIFISTFSKLELFDVRTMNNNIITRILVGYPHVLVLFGLSLLFKRMKFNLNFLFREKI